MRMICPVITRILVELLSLPLYTTLSLTQSIHHRFEDVADAPQVVVNCRNWSQVPSPLDVLANLVETMAHGGLEDGRSWFRDAVLEADHGWLLYMQSIGT